MANRYPILLPNTPDFGVNDNATKQEQEDVFNNLSNSTGIVPHSYTGADSIVSPTYLGGIEVSNPGSLVIAPNQSNSGSEVQNLKLSGGKNVVVTKDDGVISAGNELVTGGLGMSTNILLNLPSSDGTYRGRPVWNYSSMECIDALQAYQANRTRMLDPLADIIESGEYDFFIVAIPANNEDATIAWKDTYRTQVSVPAESLLVMILADTITGGIKPPS